MTMCESRTKGGFWLSRRVRMEESGVGGELLLLREGRATNKSGLLRELRCWEISSAFFVSFFTVCIVQLRMLMTCRPIKMESNARRKAEAVVSCPSVVCGLGVDANYLYRGKQTRVNKRRKRVRGEEAEDRVNGLAANKSRMYVGSWWRGNGPACRLQIAWTPLRSFFLSSLFSLEVYLRCSRVYDIMQAHPLLPTCSRA